MLQNCDRSSNSQRKSVCTFCIQKFTRYTYKTKKQLFMIYIEQTLTMHVYYKQPTGVITENEILQNR